MEHQVGRWRLTRTLGKGYFGTTYLAEDAEGVIQEPIAIKMIPLEGDRGVDEASLAKEIAQLYALTHANLVAVRAEPRRVKHNGIPYIAVGLEYCDATLADELRQSEDRDLLMRSVVPDVLAGLAYMHDVGTVHRDLHAGNILRRNGLWKIGDFGQARFVNGDGVVLGGPVGARELVAPEVANGQPASLLADVYAIGVVVHHSITGEYMVDPPGNLEAIAHHRPAIHEALPAEWRPFIRAATQELADRPTAADLRSLVPPTNHTRGKPSYRQGSGRHDRKGEGPRRPVDVACSSFVDGHFEVFALDANGAIWHSWWWDDPGWSPWEQMDAPRLTAITAGSHDERHQELFAITTDGRLVNRWSWLANDDTPNARTPAHWSNNWHEFAGPLPGDSRPVDVACSSFVDGHFEVFALDANGAIWHSWWWDDPGWSPWERMDAPRLTAITAGSHDERHQELFAITTDGRLVNRWSWLANDDTPNARTPAHWSNNWHATT